MDIEQTIDITENNIVDQFVLYTATVLFALTIILTTIQVVVRHISFLPSEHFHWTVPAARFILIVMTYVGGAVVTRNHEHISIDLMLDWIADSLPRLRRSLTVISSFVVIAFLAMALYGVGLSTVKNWSTSVGSISGITGGYIYLGMAFGLFFMLLYEVQDLTSSIYTFASRRTSTDMNEEAAEDV